LIEIEILPKAELHLHLEGSVSPSTLLELSRKYETEYASLSLKEIEEQLFQFDSFQDFLETYRIVCHHLREPLDYLRILSWLAEYFVKEKVRYAEIIYTPSIPWKFNRDGQEILVTLLEKSREIYSNQGTIIRWILDCVRQYGSEAARRTAELAHQFREEGVVGLGLGGDELSLEMKEYQGVFGWAKAHQLFIHAHAGEIGEPQQIWEAIHLLGANRIGHGIQAARDPDLMTYLRDHAISLDICLTSNLKTGAWRPISENPFGLLYERGVPVTLSTDDPGLFQVSLTEELRKAVRLFDLDEADVHRILLQGVHSSFLPHGEKMLLMKQFQDEIGRLSA
jgi:aminodeoxyfutalosine deaminase